MEAGADDVTEEDGYIEIVGDISTFKAIHDALAAANLKTIEAGLRMVPQQEVELEVDQALSILRIIENLEESDDVQNVYHNLKLTDEVIAALESE